jgi:hypothetical protein
MLNVNIKTLVQTVSFERKLSKTITIVVLNQDHFVTNEFLGQDLAKPPVDLHNTHSRWVCALCNSVCRSTSR